MARSQVVKRMVRWLHNRGWHTSSRSGESGIYMESPVNSAHGLLRYDKVSKRYFSMEYMLSLDFDFVGSKYLSVRIFQRKHFMDRDTSVPDNSLWFTYIPSDDFSEWTSWSDVPCMHLPVEDFIHIGKLLEQMRFESNIKDGSANSPCGELIGRDTSYEKIKWGYSNERLKQERGTENAYEWKP